MCRSHFDGVRLIGLLVLFRSRFWVDLSLMIFGELLRSWEVRGMSGVGRRMGKLELERGGCQLTRRGVVDGGKDLVLKTFSVALICPLFANFQRSQRGPVDIG